MQKVEKPTRGCSLRVRLGHHLVTMEKGEG